ncbi:glyoxalase-like domain protein [Staphylococcus piscifermentans]|uniref:Sulfurtransferase n=1 Tax=Staphylococcus piscifermentans TaxID=70258 RepID=A0A239TTL4_9STAP|nr:VOC family protein [Staphylococcus piscifermentans]RTX82560.1 VOC family protein [Staphylococcus piscifermentans]GEP84569.1 sulfurtransferase [Staphylococcus piscifermentans]SNV00204.1 glyoxalase-like domain protein [Staphylococcus piscifermentans]
MQNLKFDHIIHYIKHIDEFQYPGEILKVVPGGLHNRYGTHNKLAYTDLAYIELIGVNDEEKLKKVIKTNEGRVSFIAKIVQDNFKQGFKTFALRTDNIDKLKDELEAKGVETVGPIQMGRENKKGEQTSWQLLYLNQPHADLKPPFFIQWNKTEEERKATLESKFQPQFKIKAIEVQTTDTEQVVNQWRDWFDMEVIESDNDVTILKLPQEAIEFRIRKARKNGYDIVIQDKETEAPYNITTRGAEYHFLP